MKSNSTVTLKALASVAASCGLLWSCGSQNGPTKVDTKLQFVKTAANTALLEAKDLKDNFLFGLNIIKTENFYTTALSLNFRPYATKLALAKDRSGKAKLMVTDAANPSGGMLMAFDVTELGAGKLEVNFGSEQNYLQLNEGLTNQLGGNVTSEDPAARAPWKTAGKPKVLKVSQDADTVVADIEHTVSFDRLNADTGISESRTGKVTVRVFLQRNKASVVARAVKTVQDALDVNLGFFPSDRLGSASANKMPIAKYKLDTSKKESRVVYLKDFPKDFEASAKEAIAAWNRAFGYEAFKVEIAGADIDLGDPRLSVIKWFDGLEKEVPWAGYAPTMANPTDGSVLATQILINGSKTVEGIQNLAAYTEKAQTGFNGLKGKIGNVPLVEGTGETPVVTFFTDSKAANPEEFVKGYYKSIIMHEFGHSLGLRHNFLASTQLDADKLPSSVMDYEPNIVANKRLEVGSYDKAAMRWAYFNEKPTTKLVFCTDEDLSKQINCNQGDIGNPVDFVVATLTNGVGFLSNSTLALPDTVEKPMLGSMKNAFKMLKLIGQLPAADQVSAEAALNKSIELVRNAAPAADLDAAGQTVAAKNLSKVANSFKEALKSLQSSATAISSAE
jgi:hypothetical protein